MRRIGDQTDILGECPLWHEREQALYWVDIRRPAIRRLDDATGHIDSWIMPDLIGSIAFADDGRLLATLPDRIALFDTTTERLQTIAEPTVRVSDHRFNDGRCDRQGRFWAGTNAQSDTRARRRALPPCRSRPDRDDVGNSHPQQPGVEP